MEYLFSAILGYLLGSVPTAYLLLKKIKEINILETGTGNVGAMNSYEITDSKLIGLTVLIIDALKGLLSVYLCLLFFPVSFVFPAVSLFFAVFSHCFNPWLNFKGGRGLATAAGGAVLLFPFALVVWSFMYIVMYIYRKDILLANITATIASLVIIISSSQIAIKYSYPRASTRGELVLFTVALLIIIFVRHIEPLNDIIKNKNFLRKVKR
jgi:acyl phosphate:glycerol-3-phosphate acyltransferase